MHLVMALHSYAEPGCGFRISGLRFKLYALTTRTSQARFTVRGRSDTSSDRLAPFTPTGQGTKHSQTDQSSNYQQTKPQTTNKQEAGSETQAIVLHATLLHSLVFVVYSVFDCLGNALARLTEGSTEHCRNTLRISRRLWTRQCVGGDCLSS